MRFVSIGGAMRSRIRECERRNYSLTLSFVSALLSVYISFVVDYDIYSVVTLLILFNVQQRLLGAVFFSFLK